MRPADKGVDDVDDEEDEGDDCCGLKGLRRCEGDDAGSPKKMSRCGCVLVDTRNGADSCCCAVDVENETDTDAGGEDTCVVVSEELTGRVCD